MKKAIALLSAFSMPTQVLIPIVALGCLGLAGFGVLAWQPAIALPQLFSPLRLMHAARRVPRHDAINAW